MAATQAVRAPLILATDAAIFATMGANFGQFIVPTTTVLPKQSASPPGRSAQNGADESDILLQAAPTAMPTLRERIQPMPGLDVTGPALLAAGVLLLATAILTTIIRRRRLHP
jgi:hypothetical protein